jgi:hypothetical protein
MKVILYQTKVTRNYVVYEAAEDSEFIIKIYEPRDRLVRPYEDEIVIDLPHVRRLKRPPVRLIRPA